MSLCNHRPDSNSFCTLCGVEVEDSQSLVNDLPTLRIPHSLPKTYRYSIAHSNLLPSCLDHILGYLNCQNYKHQIIRNVETTPFISRCSFLDKSLLILYHSFKEDGVPVLLSDLNKYTKTNLSSKYFKEFGSRNPSELYLRNVFCRFSDLLNLKYPIEGYLHLCKQLVNTKLEIITLGYFLRNENLETYFEKHHLEKYCSINQLKRGILSINKESMKSVSIKKSCINKKRGTSCYQICDIGKLKSKIASSLMHLKRKLE